ncbi:MAG: hypothetical protein QOG16_631 [Actinomycetota bacterium]|jgi:uncharacterized membrane protein YidH (DUF202 family)|nr:hypothetical protein [Actinomycetota bacterium]
MHTVYEVLRYLSLAAFVLLAIVTYKQWRQRSDEGSKWAFLTFGSLGLIAIIGLFLPEEGSDSTAYQWFVKALIAVLAFFPYFLFRISSSFRKRQTWLRPVALALTVALAVFTMFLGKLPQPGEPRSTVLEVWLAAFIVIWVILSAVVAVRFWKAGSGQPAVARKRMRMLSIASVVLSIGIVISGFSGGEQNDVRQSITQSFSLLSVVFFFLAFAPPAWLRQSWRRPLEQQMRRGTLDLMASEDTESIMNVLLPQAVGIVGGEGIAVLDTNGKVIGSSGMDPAAIARASEVHKHETDEQKDSLSGLVHFEFQFGALVVQTGPYTPFFGQDEIDLLGALGALANLAMSRVAASDLRIQLEKADIRRQQALEINDNIVQGLAVAKYSFDLDQHDKARDAIEGTLVAARSIISELLEDMGGETDFGPGALTRDRAATGFMDSELTKQRHGSEETPQA